MSRKPGTNIRVGAVGWRAARVLYQTVKEHGWRAVGVRDVDAPKKITMGSVAAAVLQRAVPATAGHAVSVPKATSSS